MAIVVRRSARLEDTAVNAYRMIDQVADKRHVNARGQAGRLSAKVGCICALAPGEEVPLA